jgi:hypothetical protein
MTDVLSVDPLMTSLFPPASNRELPTENEMFLKDRPSPPVLAVKSTVRESHTPITAGTDSATVGTTARSKGG